MEADRTPKAGEDAHDAGASPVAIDVPEEARAVAGADFANGAAPDRGSFLLGLIAGFIGGALVLSLVYGRSKPSTRSGILWGLALQVLVLVACWEGLTRSRL